MACYQGGHQQETIDSGNARKREPFSATRDPPTDPLASSAPGVFWCGVDDSVSRESH